MSDTTINALVTIFMVALLVFITAIVVIGGVTLIWVMITDLIDAIREREEGSET
jgi:hypothetical protein